MGILGLSLVAACHAPAAATSTQHSSASPSPSPTVDQPAATSELPPLPPVKNVVLVTIDTLRADYVGAYGGPVATPVLDGLAARGWLFERCFSASMLTNPSHASIMTSLYPEDHGVYDNESGIADGVTTLATALRRHGMHTAAVIGFEHLNPDVSNLGQGFERVVPATRQLRRADTTSEVALQQIDALDPRAPFFIWVHYTDVHAPYEPPPDHPPHPVPGAIDVPMQQAIAASPGFQRHNPWFRRAFAEYKRTGQLVARYAAEVETVDAGLGVLLRGLAARGLADNTAVVVIADHGENLGEHDLFFHHGGLYSETVHVPLIVAVPHSRPRRVAGLVSSVDVAPTILALVGASPWQPMRGRNLVPVAQGRLPGREYVYSEHMLAQAVAVRSNAGTLILQRKTTHQFPSYPFVAGRRELYDTRTDPHELHPLPLQGKLAHELDHALARYLASGLRLHSRPSAHVDERELRALGYVE